MRFSFLALPFIFFFLANSATAGLNRLTIHSRANCHNNESITWDATQRWELLTISKHYVWHDAESFGDTSDYVFLHEITSGPCDSTDVCEYKFQRTKRSAAVHWGEGANGREWLVKS